MTEFDAPVPRSAGGARRRRWPRRLLLAALLLLALLAAAAAGWRGWQQWQKRADTEDIVAAQDTLLRRLSHQLGDQQADLEQQRERAADLADSNHRNADDVAALQSRSSDLEHGLAQLGAAVQGGRQRAQAIAVEQLLLIANDRAQLAHDAPGAVAALQLAQDRLSSLAEPKLFEVRKAIADERGALLAVPQVDRTAAALALGSLIDRAGSLPLRSRPPLPPNPSETGWSEVHTSGFSDAPAGGLAARGWRSIKQVLRALFVVRRTDQPVQPLLPPEQAALVIDLFDLKLESARIALLRDQTAAFRGALDSAEKLLDEDYRAEDPAVIAARAELEAMKSFELQPPLPDLSRSLGLLRAYLDAQAR